MLNFKNINLLYINNIINKYNYEKIRVNLEKCAQL